MALLDEAQAIAAKQTPGPPCGVRVFLDSLEPEVRDEFVGSLGKAPTSALVTAMRNRGYDTPSPAMVNHHRRGQCSCG